MKVIPKRIYGTQRLPGEPAAKSVTLCLREAHRQTLDQREKQLNVGRSTLIQVLLEIEERDHLLRRELVSRLRQPSKTPTPPTHTEHASPKIPNLENN